MAAPLFKETPFCQECRPLTKTCQASERPCRFLLLPTTILCQDIVSETSKTCATSATREDETFDQSRFSRTSRESRSNNEVRFTETSDDKVEGND
jgi:hypothetical protein